MKYQISFIVFFIGSYEVFIFIFLLILAILLPVNLTIFQKLFLQFDLKTHIFFLKFAKKININKKPKLQKNKFSILK